MAHVSRSCRVEVSITIKVRQCHAVRFGAIRRDHLPWPRTGRGVSGVRKPDDVSFQVVNNRRGNNEPTVTGAIDTRAPLLRTHGLAPVLKPGSQVALVSFTARICLSLNPASVASSEACKRETALCYPTEEAHSSAPPPRWEVNASVPDEANILWQSDS